MELRDRRTLEKELNELKKSYRDILNSNIKLSDEIRRTREDKKRLARRIERAIEYIEEKYEMTLKDSMENFLDHDERIEKKRLLHILEILKNDFWEDNE